MVRMAVLTGGVCPRPNLLVWCLIARRMPIGASPPQVGARNRHSRSKSRQGTFVIREVDVLVGACVAISAGHLGAQPQCVSEPLHVDACVLGNSAARADCGLDRS